MKKVKHLKNKSYTAQDTFGIVFSLMALHPHSTEWSKWINMCMYFKRAEESWLAFKNLLPSTGREKTPENYMQLMEPRN